jgi:hypothetical protein
MIWLYDANDLTIATLLLCTLYDLNMWVFICMCYRPLDHLPNLQHLRYFLIEMPKRGLRLGYEELGPNETVSFLLPNAHRGQKVAVVSSYQSDALVEPYVQAMKERGLSVRVVPPQSATADFCFLQSTQHEMIGVGVSTYFGWAGLLSNASLVHAYSVDSPARRERAGTLDDPNYLLQGYKWEFARDLSQRFLFDLHAVNHSYIPTMGPV